MLDTLIEFIKEHSVEALAVWGGIITLASLIVKFTPTKKDDAIWGVILKILNALALNPNIDKIKEEVKKEISERDNDTTRNGLTNALR